MNINNGIISINFDQFDLLIFNWQQQKQHLMSKSYLHTYHKLTNI